jgi:sterol desaturase/sphingolipid hydroxylase (fatty acid hydroxylase superfamily)
MEPTAWFDIARDVVLLFDSPSEPMWWGYLLVAFAVAIAVHRRRSGNTLSGLGRSLVPHRSAWRRAWHDAAIFVINTVGVSLVFLPTIQLASSLVSSAIWGLAEHALGPLDTPWTGVSARIAMTLAVVVVVDVAFFAAHWLQHRIGVLWEFHKVHHSAEILTPFTVARVHPVEVLIESYIIGVALGGLYGVAGWLSGEAPDVYEILGVNVLLFAFRLLFNLQHSHIWLTFGCLERVFISPAAHQIHHSTDPRHHGRNYGNIFALWDWLCGTHVRPGAPIPLRVGLGGDEDHEYRRLWRLYLWPFVKVVRRAFPARP